MNTTLTRWVNEITGLRLDRGMFTSMLAKAHTLYEANGHIFEDEFEALSALGVVPWREPELAAA